MIMANDLNVLALTGRLVREAELKYSNGGMAFGKFTLAVNRSVKKGDKWEDDANYFDCTLFGKSAEGLNPYLTKGRQVAIQGELTQSRWEQDGQNRSRVEIMVKSLQLLAAPKGETQSEPVSKGYTPPPYTPSFAQDPSVAEQGTFGSNQFNDEDIPF